MELELHNSTIILEKRNKIYSHNSYKNEEKPLRDQLKIEFCNNFRNSALQITLSP